MSERRVRVLPFLLVLGGLGAWFLLLGPAGLGGPVSYVCVSGSSMEPGLETGDLAIVRHSDRYQRGDVVAFRIPEGEPGEGGLVIHRIVGGSSETGFVTQGDNRLRPDSWRPAENDIVGNLWVTVPGAGRLLARMREPAMAGALAASLAVFTVLLRGEDAGRRPRALSMPGVSALRSRDAWTLAELCSRYAAPAGRRRQAGASARPVGSHRVSRMVQP
jgi:signal peptidase I